MNKSFYTYKYCTESNTELWWMKSLLLIIKHFVNVEQFKQHNERRVFHKLMSDVLSIMNIEYLN